MALHVFKLHNLAVAGRSSVIFGMLLISMLWAGIALKHVEDLRTDERDAERTIQNFAMVFEENVLRSIGEIDKALLYLRRTIENPKDDSDFASIANSADVVSEIIVQVAIIDAKGIMRASNAGPQPAPPLDLSDREHYRVHVNGVVDQLFISKPVIGRASGRWSVQFTRRFRDQNGDFAGVVVASLDPDHLTKFYDRIDLGASASISLIGGDGVVRSSGGNAGSYALGQDVGGSRLFAAMGSGESATFETGDGGSERLVSVRKVKGQPLWVAVAIDTADIYRQSAANLKLLALAGLVLTLIILAATKRILRTENKARQKAEQLRLTLEHMSQGIILVTRDGQVPVSNGRCTELLDVPHETIENPARLEQLLGRDGADRRATDAPDAGAVVVRERRMPNGKVIEIRTGHLPDGSVVQTFTDVTQRCEAEAHVARLASEDPLTGLPNRRVFGARLDEISRERTAPEKKPDDFAVLFLDLDRFKLVNDTLGHRIGDRLLQEMARRLERTVAPEHVLARLGGDEFAVVVPKVHSRAELEALASRIGAAVSEPGTVDGHPTRTSVSIGIAVGPADGDNADDLVKAADLALYAVKSQGRGGWQFFDRSMNKALSDRREIEIDLREALERDELELHYQPVVRLRDNRVVGLEALARWNHPVRGPVPPGVFVPVAEDSGLILPLGEWALREACRQAATWPAHLRVAVNLSPAQFATPDMVDRLRAILEETGLAPERLELEITERIFLADNERNLSTLHRLKAIGLRIAMDDFGTGYSSLSYLRSFPFDKIKIDRTFVSGLDQGTTDHMVIVQSVVSIARALGMTTTAEGVETAEQHRALVALGCGEGQGYLFSRPVPAGDLPKVIRALAERQVLVA
jgi:diguanylate cyclase (GGDEF)-like protein